MNTDTDILAASGRNLASWHDSSLRALGLRTRWSEDLWWCEDPTPVIYLSAITLAPGDPDSLVRRMAQVTGASPTGPLAVWDSFAHLDLSALGLVAKPLEPWYVREPGPRPEGSDPVGLSIEEIRTEPGLAEFERATVEGFEGPPGIGRFEQHAPGILDDPTMRAYSGRVDGRVVSVAMACVGTDVVGVYGVATIPAFRRRGYGAALTWRAALAAPDRPAILQPSEEGIGMYRALGFRERARSRPWWRPADPP